MNEQISHQPEFINSEDLKEILRDLDDYYGISDLSAAELYEVKRIANQLMIDRQKLFAAARNGSADAFRSSPCSFKDEIAFRLMEELYGMNLRSEYFDGNFDQERFDEDGSLMAGRDLRQKIAEVRGRLR